MTVLAVNDLHRSFGGIRAVDGVTFDVEQAEIVGIIGPNGSGKSTLFNLLTGALKPDAGTISLSAATSPGSLPTGLPGLAWAAPSRSRHCS